MTIEITVEEAMKHMILLEDLGVPRHRWDTITLKISQVADRFLDQLRAEEEEEMHEMLLLSQKWDEEDGLSDIPEEYL